MTDLWLELARRVTADQREHTTRAEQAWRILDLTAAAHLRGIADGLERARDHQLAVAQAEPGVVTDDPIDGAMHAFWLHGKWRWATSKMSPEEREAAADAVTRYSLALHAADGLPPTQLLILEVLAARYRLGEGMWTFPRNHTAYLAKLAAARLVDWWYGPDPARVQATLTDQGKTAMGLDRDYYSDAELEARALDRAVAHLRAIDLLDERPVAWIYLEERAAKLRAGVGWEDEKLQAALEAAALVPPTPRKPRPAPALTLREDPSV